MIRKFGLVREFSPQPVGGKAVRVHGLRAKCASNDGFNREALHRLGEATRREVRHQARQARQEGGAEAQQETRSPKRAGRWVCLTQQPPPVTGCVKVELHSVCAPRLLRGRGHTYPHTAPLAPWVARSSVGSRVARRLPGRHSLVAASPLRCRTGLSSGCRRTGRPPPGVLKVVFCPQAHAWTRLLSSMWRD